MNESNIKQKYGVPAILSFLVPGLGQLIKGHVFKSFLFFFGVLIGLAFLIVPGFIIWVWSVKDAYNS